MKKILRIEVDRESMGRLLESARQVVNYMKSIGFTYITLDLAGFRSGSLNEVLKFPVKNKVKGSSIDGTAN